MKRLKKILALALAMAMVLGMTSMAAFAAYSYTPVEAGATYDSSAAYFTDAEGTTAYEGGEDGFETAIGTGLWIRSGEPDSEPAEPAEPAGPADKTLTISGLATGDVVKYYKIIEWKADGSGWGFLAPWNSELTEAQKTEIIGSIDTSTTPATVVPGKITDTTATAMANQITSSTTAIVPNGDTVSGTSWTAENVDPGLYVALITAAAPTADNDMVIYNPVFVAVQADGAGSEVALPLTYDNSGTAKKSTITVDKKAKDDEADDSAYAEATTQNVGDIIDFKVETTVPAYLESWTNPVFTVTDSLTSGLTLAVGAENALSTITVKAGETTLTENTDYTVSNKTATGYKITFTDSYLKGLAAAQLVTITYQAKITDDAANVNPETNTVTIEYSKNPTTASDHGTKEDKTTHYTFDIDAGLQGDENYTTSEIIKVGVDAAGNPVTEEKTYSNTTKHNPLQGAEFKIYTDAACTTPYTNSTITTDTVFTSSDMGLLNIKGIDEGTYYLKETKAATGYMLLTDKLKFVITATYKDVAATATCNAYKELDTYKVEVFLVNGTTGAETATGTSNYTLNNGTITKTGGVAGDASTEVKNTQGTSLPSTGGIGTTIFYIVGTILVIGAGVALITKRRMDA